MHGARKNGAVVWLVAAALLVVTLGVYWQVRGHEFTNVDDRLYVSENGHVLSGLSAENVVWAFTDSSTGNWHPLTWLSLMLDCQLWGDKAAGTHLTNLLLHLANTLLLFFVLRRMSAATWPAAFVAALFALHPLHVESVAWVSERKDVLSTLFWLLTMWAYARWVERRTVARYAPIVVFFALGLMAKSMLVTLPFALLLLDFWPLRRFGFDAPAAIGKLVVEKLPLIAITAALSVVAFATQSGAGAVLGVENIAPGARVAHAIVVYVKYLGKLFWPQALQVHYRHYGMPPVWQTALATLFIAGMLLLGWRLRTRSPYVLSGWLWYLGTLVPVIGLVQIGAQDMADRYTYIPSIGVFLVVAWGIRDLSAGWKMREALLAAGAAALLLPLAFLTYRQAGVWRDSLTLHGHSVRVAPENYHGHMGLAQELEDQGRLEEAALHYAEVLRIVPTNLKARYRLGNTLERQARPDLAAEHYRRSLELLPDDDNLRLGLARSLNNLGSKTIRNGGDESEAQGYYEEAVEVLPAYNNARMNLANLKWRSGDFDGAIALCKEALTYEPDHKGAHNLIQLLTPFLEKQRELSSKQQESGG